MKRILVLTKDYFKLSSPNAICIQGIVNEWKSNNIEVDIISAENNKCISNKHNIFISKPTVKLQRIKKLISYPLDSDKLVQEYEKAIESCILNNNYDLIIAVVNPTETAQALCNIKKEYPNLKTCLYEIDPISNRYKIPKNLLEKYLRQRAVSWSCKIYSKLDCVIHMVTHKTYFDTDLFSEFQGKSYYLDIPALRFVNEKDNVNSQEKITIVYAGAFYKKLRNPIKIINALKIVCSKHPVKVLLYINNIMQDEIRRITESQRESFYISGYIPEKELNEILMSSSILLSVGNKDSDFLPSKIFTYFGMNKPVIHYSFDTNDVALPYLQKYGNSLCVSDQDSIEILAEKMEKFILEKDSKIYSKEELNTMFIENTPQYNAEKIIEYCEV